MPVAVRVPNHDDTIMRKIIENEDVIWLAMQQDESNTSPSQAKSAIDKATMEMAQRRSRRPRNPLLCEPTARSETARDRNAADKLRSMRECGLDENSTAYMMNLEKEGRLDKVEELISKVAQNESNFLQKSDFIVLSNRGKSPIVPSRTARDRKHAERARLEAELEILEAAIKAEKEAKTIMLTEASSARRKGTNTFARKSNDATAHFRKMTITKSEKLYLNRFGGYTTFGDQGKASN